MRSHHPTLALFVAAVTLLVSDVALAQDCNARDADIFQTARRSRTIVADYTRFHNAHADDLQRNIDFAKRTHQPLTWRVDVAGIIDIRQTFGFNVCTNTGPWGAKLAPFVAGGLLSADVFPWHLGVEAFVLTSTDVLEADPTEAQTRTPDAGYKEPTGLANVQVGEHMEGLRLTLHDWASLVVAHIGSRPVKNYAGVDGRQIIVSDSQQVRPDRIYLGLGTPLGGGMFNVIFQPYDVYTDVIGARFDKIPLGVGYLRGIAGASYVRDEKEPVLELGVGAFHFLTATASTEFHPLRLRAARVRAEWSGGPETVLHDGSGDSARAALDLGTFVQASYFNSRHLEEQTGEKNVWGVEFGGVARPDITILMLQFDLWFGVNRPDQLARISDFVDHWQMGLRVHGRFGI